MRGRTLALPPTISVVTPSLNQAAYIESCILSVRNQLTRYDEHIVVDGGSTDGTIDVLKRHEHVKWVSEPDRGQADALNKAIRMASGDLVGWLNADDAYLDGALETVRRFFTENPDVALTYGYVYVVDSCGRPIRKRFSPDFNFGLLVRNGACYAQPTFFFQRSLFDELGYLDPHQRWAMDYDLILRVGERFPIRKIAKCLGMFRTHAGSMSHSGQADPRLLATALAIRAQYQPLLRHRYPPFLYRVHDAGILVWFKLLGRIMSVPMWLKYHVSSHN